MVSMEEIEITEQKTMAEFMDELQLSSASVLLQVNGELCYPDEIKDRGVRKGDKVTLIPLIAGG